MLVNTKLLDVLHDIITRGWRRLPELMRGFKLATPSTILEEKENAVRVAKVIETARAHGWHPFAERIDSDRDGPKVECYRPCPPFKDFCNAFNSDFGECVECAEKYGLLDYIE